MIALSLANAVIGVVAAQMTCLVAALVLTWRAGRRMDRAEEAERRLVERRRRR